MITRRISLFTGLFLFAFLFAHLVNLSLGLISVDTMDQARSWLLAPWTNSVGGALLALSLLLHMLLGLRALYSRNTLRLSGFDAFQLLLGLSIPLLLFPHIITMAMLPAMTGVHATYQQVLSLFWIDNAWLGLRQVVGLMAVWLHSCMGLFVWMRLQNWWGSIAFFVYPTVVLLPTLAMLGFVEAGKEVIADTATPTSTYQSDTAKQADGGSAYGSYGADSGDAGNSGYASNSGYSSNSGYGAGSGYSEQSYGGSDSYSSGGGYGEESNNSSTGSYGGGSSYGEQSSYGGGGSYGGYNVDSADTVGNNFLQTAERTVWMAVTGYLVLLLLVLMARAVRVYSCRQQQARIVIGDSEEFTIASGTTLLEVSRLNDIRHASLCGGKGRCGTCQVHVREGQEHLTPVTKIEASKLRQIDAPADIRLACQAHVSGGRVHVEPVLPGYVVAADMPHRRAQRATTAPVDSTPDIVTDGDAS